MRGPYNDDDARIVRASIMLHETVVFGPFFCVKVRERERKRQRENTSLYKPIQYTSVKVNPDKGAQDTNEVALNVRFINFVSFLTIQAFQKKN